MVGVTFMCLFWFVVLFLCWNWRDPEWWVWWGDVQLRHPKLRSPTIPLPLRFYLRLPTRSDEIM